MTESLGGNVDSPPQGASAPLSAPDDLKDSQVITARGTEAGLVLRIDGRAAWENVLGEINQFLGGKRRFFAGGELSVEWLDRLPTKEQSDELSQLLREQYGIEIVSRARRKPTLKRLTKEETEALLADSGVGVELRPSVSPAESTGAIDLGQRRQSAEGSSSSSSASSSSQKAQAVVALTGSDSRADELSRRYMNRMVRGLGEELEFEDDANAKVIYGILRSGQRVETPFSLIVVGDVNPGADLVAGGDIIVIGSLKGTAHAGAYDDEAFDRVIISLQMQPMQLRIGSVISRGSDEVVRGAEIARIDNRRIVVEAFNPRVLFSRKNR